MDDLDRLLARWNAPTPRYTSYPTAPHFAPEVDGAVADAWLEGLDPAAPASLYVHIPFCDTLCWFCGCRTRVVNRYAPVTAYVDDLEREIARMAAMSAAGTLQHIHWGGGSPSMLEPGDIARIARRIRTEFDGVETAEFAVEFDPRDLSPDRVAAFAEAGLTRASIGVQDADPAVQAAINRHQPMDVTAAAVEALRLAGVASINIDLVTGLPQQTEETVARTVEAVLALRPERLAVFGYAHVPQFAPRQKVIDAATLPGPRARYRQAELVADMAVAAGYARIGLDHFAVADDGLAVAAREGRVRRNFQGYTDDACETLLPVGASAIGETPQGYLQNAPDVAPWRSAVRSGRSPVVRGVAVTAEDRARRAVIHELMCTMAVDLAAVASAHGMDPATFAPDLPALAALEDDGLVERTGWTVRIPERGRAFMRVAAACFDARGRANGAVHAKAV